MFIGDGSSSTSVTARRSPLRLRARTPSRIPNRRGAGRARCSTRSRRRGRLYEPAIAGLEERRPRGRDGGSCGGGSQPVSDIYFLKREVLQVDAAVLCSCRSSAGSPPRPVRHEKMEEVFRDVYDDRAHGRTRSTSSATCCPACGRAPDSRSACARTRTCARSWRGRDPCRADRAGRRGRHEVLRHAETGLAPRYPAALATMAPCASSCIGKFRSIDGSDSGISYDRIWSSQRLDLHVRAP